MMCTIHCHRSYAYPIAWTGFISCGSLFPLEKIKNTCATNEDKTGILSLQFVGFISNSVPSPPPLCICYFSLYTSTP